MNIGVHIFFLIGVFGILRKLRSYTAKETINKMKREPTVWRDIFANDISGKGLISKIYKELTQHQEDKQSY